MQLLPLYESQIKLYSNFWIGIYGDLWVIAGEFLIHIVQDMMKINRHKLANYQSGLRVMNLLQMTHNI